MVLGIYYLTILKDKDAQIKGTFFSYDDAISAHEAGILKLHDKIIVRDEHGAKIETTVGRIIFNEAVRSAVLSS